MTVNNDCISRREAINALWKALYAYEDKTEKQFQESDELDVSDWIMHRKFVQNMSDIDRQVIRALPSIQPTLYGYQIEHLAYIAKVMEKEGVTAEYATKTFEDISRAVRMIIEEAQQKAEEMLNGCCHQNLMQKGAKNEDCGKNSQGNRQNYKDG